jgi:hypothetical protein
VATTGTNGVRYAIEVTSQPKQVKLPMQNQTEEIWLSGASSDGTGVFVFPEGMASEFGKSDWTQSIKANRYGTVQKALVANISYERCAERGEQNWMIGYKWVPRTLASFEMVLAAAKACSGQPCVQRCAAYGCICISGACT